MVTRREPGTMDAHRRRAWTKSQQISIGGAHRRASSLRRETLASQLAAKREAIMAIKISKHTKPVRISEVLEKIEARRRHTEQVAAINAASSKPGSRRNEQIAEIKPASSER